MMGWDKRSIRTVETLLASNSLGSSQIDLLNSLEQQYRQKGFFTGAQRQLVKNLKDQNDDNVKDADLAARLQEMVDNGQIEPLSVSFVSSVLQAQLTYGRFTIPQREHVEKILRGNTDPEDEEINQAQVRKNKLTRGGDAW
jgi:hypothetical protein